MIFNPFVSLDDAALEASLMRSAALERDANADIILHLMLIKERRLYVAGGYDSLFSYCTQRLGFSRSTAYRRKAIVDRADCFPSLIDRLRDGRLQLCAAAAIAPHLDDGSAEILMDEVKGLSHREVEAFLIKNWRTKETPPSSTPAPAPNRGEEGVRGSFKEAEPHKEERNKNAIHKTVVKPVSIDLNRVNVTFSDSTLLKLQRAKDLLSGSSDDEIFGKALDALLEKIAPERRHERRTKRLLAFKKKASTTTNPKCGTSSDLSPARSRRGRLADRDKVITEAGARCSFKSKEGVQCTARRNLEIDHIRPWALGGESSAANFRVLCRKHNRWLAEKTFGPWARGAPRSNGESSDRTS